MTFNSIRPTVEHPTCHACLERPAVINGMCSACFFIREQHRAKLRYRYMHVAVWLLYAVFLVAMLYLI